MKYNLACRNYRRGQESKAGTQKISAPGHKKNPIPTHQSSLYPFLQSQNIKSRFSKETFVTSSNLEHFQSGYLVCGGDCEECIGV